MAFAIETKRLTKEYVSLFGMQRVMALDGLTLGIEEGEIFGFLGPNGAGKTTAIKLLLGLLFPSKGSSFILGKNSKTSVARKKVGYLPEGSYFQDFLSGEEALRFYGKLYGLRGTDLEGRIDRCLSLVGLEESRGMHVRFYSKGMRQRVGLAQALLSDPQVLIMDEPTTGLDPIARREIRDILVGLRQEGKTLLICSHELAEVEMICDRIAILNRGRVIAVGTLPELIYHDQTYQVTAYGVSNEFAKQLEAEGYTVTHGRGHEKTISIPGGAEASKKMLDLLEANKAQLVSMKMSRETLEDLFVRLVKEGTAGEVEAVGASTDE
ncbi:ABC transporter ATP-binding protein [Candidatus Hydrogenedentota bacterium]